MTIGIIVDGQAEYYGLPLLLSRVTSSIKIKKTLYCDIQPLANPEQIAHVTMKKVPILIQKGVSDVVVLLDLEARSQCPSIVAASVRTALKKRMLAIYPQIGIEVVIKVASFENWLVADPEVFVKLKGRFENQESIKHAVNSNKADSINALALLKRCTRKKDYDKIGDAKTICKNINPDIVGMNSRSFRRFLRVLGHPSYADQSRQPLSTN